MMASMAFDGLCPREGRANHRPAERTPSADRLEEDRALEARALAGTHTVPNYSSLMESALELMSVPSDETATARCGAVDLRLNATRFHTGSAVLAPSRLSGTPPTVALAGMTTFNDAGGTNNSNSDVEEAEVAGGCSTSAV